jgi:plasmid stabilization system protein ParE
MLGTDRRDYPLLRGAIVKLAHDDPNLASRLLAALLPAQGAAMEGPLGYDITIRGTGTFGVAIAGGRAGVEPLNLPRGRHVAEFHLTSDPLVFAELLAGVDHRIGRFFGPVRVRGRKRAVKALRALRTTTASLTDAARAGADLDPELVYRTFAYAVHPTWTRGHDFTIAQSIAGDPTETWYLTAADSAGLTVSSNPPATGPVATVEMSREVFRKLLRDEPVPHGQRPTVHGDRHAVALMHEWTQRARGAH